MMARVELKLPEDLIQKLSTLADRADDIIPKALEDGGAVVLSRVRGNLQSVVGRDTKYPSRSTGTLEAALGMSPVKVDSKGVYNVKIGFSEPRSGGNSNAKVANILEHGKHGQPPKPFLAPAKASSRAAAIAAMKSRLEREIDSL
jgi:hypothetical protein